MRVRLAAYVPLHPAASHLAELDAQVARLGEKTRMERVAPVPPPSSARLPEPTPPGERPVRVEPPEGRAEAEIRHDFALREEAEPDRAAEWLAEELDRLRREVASARAETEAAHEEPVDLEQAVREAEQLSRLRQRLRGLEEKPGDGLLYRPEVLRQRREEALALRRELAILENNRRLRLEKALQVKPQSAAATPQVPPERIREAERKRDILRAEARRRLAELERQALERARKVPPSPQPAPAEVPALAAEPEPDARAAMTALTEQPGRLPGKLSDAPWRGARQRLRERRELLRARILDDLRAAAAAAARQQGYVLQTEASTGSKERDVTDELRPWVQRVLTAPARSAAR
ncbi:MAG: hypothetical protein ACK47B_22840 [Armatimonadota bacterium]